MCLSVSLPEVFGKEGCVPGAGRGPCRSSSSGQPTDRLCVTAAKEPSCSLATHHHHHHYGLLSALWPQCCKMQPLLHLSFLLSFSALYLLYIKTDEVQTKKKCICIVSVQVAGQTFCFSARHFS